MTIPLICLTGGPGGGKTALLEALRQEKRWSERVLTLPEAITVVGRVGLSIHEKRFQYAMVNVQVALEEALQRSVEDPSLTILCHRGSLDPLAYWLANGWGEEEFFTCTGIKRDQQYARYAAVLHLVTAADGAPDHYRRWPHAHRAESPEQAVRLDRLLQAAWQAHPQYLRLANEGRDWPTKLGMALDFLKPFLGG